MNCFRAWAESCNSKIEIVQEQYAYIPADLQNASAEEITTGSQDSF